MRYNQLSFGVSVSLHTSFERSSFKSLFHCGSLSRRMDLTSLSEYDSLHLSSSMMITSSQPPLTQYERIFLGLSSANLPSPNSLWTTGLSKGRIFGSPLSHPCWYIFA